jgi:hypothetical protein
MSPAHEPTSALLKHIFYMAGAHPFNVVSCGRWKYNVTRHAVYMRKFPADHPSGKYSGWDDFDWFVTVKRQDFLQLRDAGLVEDLGGNPYNGNQYRLTVMGLSTAQSLDVPRSEENMRFVRWQAGGPKY